MALQYSKKTKSKFSKGEHRQIRPMVNTPLPINELFSGNLSFRCVNTIKYEMQINE